MPRRSDGQAFPGCPYSSSGKLKSIETKQDQGACLDTTTNVESLASLGLLENFSSRPQSANDDPRPILPPAARLTAKAVIEASTMGDYSTV